MIAKARLLVSIGLLAVLLLFIFLNLQQVNVNFIIGNAQMPVAFVILIAALLGGGAVLAFRFWKSVKREPK